MTRVDGWNVEVFAYDSCDIARVERWRDPHERYAVMLERDSRGVFAKIGRRRLRLPEMRALAKVVFGRVHTPFWRSMAI